jgi:hypothetical protein
MSRSHMNFCRECRRAFELVNNPDYCEKCRIYLGFKPGDISDKPLIVEQIEFAFASYKEDEEGW